MQCKDFRELADSYLSDELLVETNHEVFRHMEDCKDCRRELGGRREVRTKLRAAVSTAPESQIEAVFAANLQQSLEKEAFRGNGFAGILQAFYAPKIFAATAAVLLVAFLIGFAFWENTPNLIASNDQLYKTAWTNVSAEAVGDHRHCALDKYDYWMERKVSETAEEKLFKAKVMDKVQSETGETARLLSIHNCSFGGRKFHHAIINAGRHTISFSQTASEIAPDANNIAGARELFSQQIENFRLAGFAERGDIFYVISDLPEAENSRLAHIFSGSLQAENKNPSTFAAPNFALYTVNRNF